MLKCNFNLPKFYNSGKSVDPAIIADLEKQIIDITGGISKYNVSGAWIENGKTYTDENNFYFVTIPENNIIKLKAVLLYAKKVLRQESIYFDSQRVEVEFL